MARARAAKRGGQNGQNTNKKSVSKAKTTLREKYPNMASDADIFTAKAKDGQITADIEANRTKSESSRLPDDHASFDRSLWRREGVTGRYVQRKSRKKLHDDNQPAEMQSQWVWFARAKPFVGKTVGEWRAEARRTDAGRRIDAKYALLEGEDDDPIKRGTKDQVFKGTHHITHGSGRLIKSDLDENKSKKVVIKSRSHHSKDLMDRGIGGGIMILKKQEQRGNNVG